MQELDNYFCQAALFCQVTASINSTQCTHIIASAT